MCNAFHVVDVVVIIRVDGSCYFFFLQPTLIKMERKETERNGEEIKCTGVRRQPYLDPNTQEARQTNAHTHTHMHLDRPTIAL